ncbi:MAG: isocitrate/isopropylmalate dehydrogenase family protein [Methanobacterium sp.]|jgi:methanogen homoisocitrate dehydrogenase|uniref:isocitrate/isopropylmalate dehydrogenase family protein n=1 Tax=Methanobacterium sp. TaxID=2164 RepID=UPI00258BCD1B|nr:isocitrate/isopropylmalate dehydrogenase family protein [Methanobacterium sp.]MCC7560824.1 isocitrate/isopropylmalate dehydrogenase family protein [Methanobacterium sp.]
MYTITVIPGDGIGPEVMGAAMYVLEALNIEFKFQEARAGNDCYHETGTTIPDETIEMAKNSDATLFGAVTTVSGQKSAIITLRKAMGLYANLRPVKSYPGVNSVYSDLDFLIVRENSEGLYSGVEQETEDGATALRVITRKASERISEIAFKQALKLGKTRVTAVHKANVLKKTDGVFRKAFWEIARKYTEMDEYSHMEVDELYVDAAAMFMVQDPHRFQVLVTTNLFGDILSDEGAGLVGGLGMVPSSNIGDNNGLFEPVHGSAPDIAGSGVANPAAMILSTSLMLQFLEEHQESFKLEQALLKVLKQRKYLTVDLGGTATTMEMAHAVREILEEC